MNVTFDSNVWRIVASPDTFPNEPSIDAFRVIRTAIIEKRLTPFLCETVFTLEAIRKRNRKSFFSEYRPQASATEESNRGGIKQSTVIGPDRNAHPGNNSYLESHLKDAMDIGFKIVRFPRIGGVVNPDIEAHLCKHDDLESYHDKVFAAGKAIESRGAGMAHIKELGEKYGDHWIAGIQQAPEYEAGHIAKAIAEWADGDSVACHIAIGGDYFCTRDSAHNAGNKSIFSESNQEWLKATYGLQTVTPEDLASEWQEIT